MTTFEEAVVSIVRRLEGLEVELRAGPRGRGSKGGGRGRSRNKLLIR